MPQVIVPPDKVMEAISALVGQQLDVIRDAAREAAVEVAARGEFEAVLLTDELGLVDLGHYKRSFTHQQRSYGATLDNTAAYAGDLEWGRRPGRPAPPFDAIRGWVGRKLGLDGKEADQAAWAIRRKIALYGTKPYHVLWTISRRIRKWWYPAIMDRLRRRTGRRGPGGFNGGGGPSGGGPMGPAPPPGPKLIRATGPRDARGRFVKRS